MVKEGPACVRCHGRNWIDLGIIAMHKEESLPKNEREIHLYQCGGGVAYCDPEDVKNGCARLIRATPADMIRAGMI